MDGIGKLEHFSHFILDPFLSEDFRCCCTVPCSAR